MQAAAFLLLWVPVQDGDAHQGAKIFNSRCANCHGVPDASIKRDVIWTELIKTTA
jgi:mono/diheme cytochrome c family protein